MKILITGVAGFIGFHLASELLKKKYNIIGVDNIKSLLVTNSQHCWILMNHLKQHIFVFLITRSKNALSSNRNMALIFSLVKNSF